MGKLPHYLILFPSNYSASSVLNDSEPELNLPSLTLRAAIGIAIAITGNVIISLALICQKLAHQKLDQEREKTRMEAQETRRTNSDHGDPTLNHVENDENEIITDGYSSNSDSTASPRHGILLESEPLILSSSDRFSQSSYGANLDANNTTIDRWIDGHIIAAPQSSSRRERTTSLARQLLSMSRPSSVGHSSQTLPSRRQTRPSSDMGPDQHTVLPVQVFGTDCLNGQSAKSNGSAPGNESTIEHDDENESDYLKSKLWWFGFLLMNIGEMGNFISYAFAPASVVAPLGTFALIANCIFAPLILGERFRKLDLFGILVAVLGATTVVLSTPASDKSTPPLDPEALKAALSQRPFVVFSIVYAASAAVLGTLSEGSVGKNVVFVDIGLCALFGGFTVLSTKGISTLLTQQGPHMFTAWITYPILAVLIVTGVLQIRYLNRALRRFDSKLVIPTQFVLFTLSAVIGSAVLYGDFRRATFHQMVTFLYGCGATFAGVFIIAWAPNGGSTAEVEGDDDGVEEGSVGRADVGSLRRRHQAVLVIPSGARDVPKLKNKRSSVGLIGLSPAQHLLLVHTPPARIRTQSTSLSHERDTEGETVGSAARRGTT